MCRTNNQPYHAVPTAGAFDELDVLSHTNCPRSSHRSDCKAYYTRRSTTTSLDFVSKQTLKTALTCVTLPTVAKFVQAHRYCDLANTHKWQRCVAWESGLTVDSNFSPLSRNVLVWRTRRLAIKCLDIFSRRATLVGQALPVRPRFAEYNQLNATFHNLFISTRRSTCFRRFLRPSSGGQNCTYSVRYMSDQYCYLLLALPGQASSR